MPTANNQRKYAVKDIVKNYFGIMFIIVGGIIVIGCYGIFAHIFWIMKDHGTPRIMIICEVILVCVFYFFGTVVLLCGYLLKPLVFKINRY